MTDTLYGKCLTVETRNLGEPAVADVAVGQTVIPVQDAATFDETGGFVTIGGAQLAYVATDVDADTITLAAALTVAVTNQDLIEVHPPQPVKTALVDMLDNSDPVPATVPHNLLDRLGDGVRDPGAQETLQLTRRGAYEYTVADVTAEDLLQQSLDYEVAQSGIGLSTAIAQVQDLQALGSIGTGVLSADSIALGGTDLQAQLGGFSIGKILSARLAQQPASIALSTTNTKLFELNCGTVQGGRTYRANLLALLQATGTLALTDRVLFEFRYTLDGSIPTTTSSEMANSFDDWSYIPGNSVAVNASGEIDIVDPALLRVALCGRVVSGAGSYFLYAGASSRSRPQMSLYDDGPSGARNDAAITLTGGGTTRFIKTFSATWSWGVDAANGTSLTNSWGSIGGSDDMACYVGFDGTAMVAALANASIPVSLIARWRPRSRVSSSGLDARIGTHNFTSAAAASGANSGWPAFAHANLGVMGISLLSNIRNNGVPNSSYDESLGVTVFNQFKAGSRKGLAFLGEPEFAPGGEGSVYLDGTNQVQLIFTYDGTS